MIIEYSSMLQIFQCLAGPNDTLVLAQVV